MSKRGFRIADVNRSATPSLPAMNLLGAGIGGALGGVLLLSVLRLAGLETPWWGLPSASALLTLSAQEPWQRVLGGGSLANRPTLRVALALVEFGYLLHLVGLGFLLPVTAVLIAAVHLQWSGSRAWRPIVRVTVVVTGLNQALIQSGWVPTQLPPAVTHALWPLITGIAVMAIANIGITTSAREKLNKRLAAAEVRFRTLVQNSSDVIAVADAAGVFSYVSPAAGSVLGRPATELEGAPAAALVDPADRAEFAARLATVVTGPPVPIRWEARQDAVDGPVRWLEFTADNLLDQPELAGVRLHIRDVSERREFEDRLAYSAAHDTLTGLHGRAELLQRAGELLAVARPGAAVAVLFCDLDRFKQVNDTFGHGAGDEVLVTVAGRLLGAVRTDDLVARMGGDEFAIVLPGLTGPDVATATVGRIDDAVTAPIMLSGGELVVVGVSIGLTVVEDGPADPDEVLDRADASMYAAKWTHRTAADDRR